MCYENIQRIAIEFLQTQAKLANCDNFIVGISGGIDSAIVSLLCKQSGIKTTGLILPTNNSNKKNLDDAINHCNKFDIDYKIINISKILDEFKFLDTDKVRFGNITARVRMILLYDFSKRFNACVVGTSNLSERMLGYGTIYGDLAYAFNPIGEIFKTEIFEFGKFLGIDNEIITKSPSADLYENQSDEMEFGFSYEQIDSVLKEIYNKDYSIDLLKQKFDQNLVNFVIKSIKANEFKSHMPNIAKIRSEK